MRRLLAVLLVLLFLSPAYAQGDLRSVVGKVQGTKVNVRGSGFVVGPTTILTVKHLIDAAEGGPVHFILGDRTLTANLVCMISDLAVVQTLDPINAPPLRLENRIPAHGEIVATAGWPQWVWAEFPMRVFSADAFMTYKTEDFTYENIRGFFLVVAVGIDIPTLFGISGSPVLDKEGDVIGVMAALAPTFNLVFAVHVRELGKCQEFIGK